MSKLLVIRADLGGEHFIEEARAKGSIRCLFNIEIDGFSFPNAGFFDFPVIVLSWWLDNLLAMMGGVARTQNSFMDGPYEYLATRNGNLMTLEFVERKVRGKRSVGKPVQMPFDHYRAALTETALALIQALDRLDYSSDDFNHLRLTLNLVASFDR